MTQVSHKPVLIDSTGKEFPILDPGVHRRNCDKYGNLPREWWGRANSYRCPRGKESGVAWLLMLRRDVEELDKESLMTLKWRSSFDTLEVENMVFVRAIAQTPGLSTDKDRAYLVELRDKRHFLQWSAFQQAYNLRKPTIAALTGNNRFIDPSGNKNQMAATWEEMVQDIWGYLPAIAGSAPSLSYTGQPDGFLFNGTAWDALFEALSSIVRSCSFNPITGTFTFIAPGEQSGLAASESTLGEGKRLIYNYDPIESTLGNVPANINFYFRFRKLFNESMPDGMLTWEDDWNTHHEVEQAIGAAGQTGTAYPFFADPLAALSTDDFSGGSPSFSDITTAVSALKTSLFALWVTYGDYSHKRYAGLSTEILPGSQVDEVLWRDYGDGQGMVTEVIQRPFKLYPHKFRNYSMEAMYRWVKFEMDETLDVTGGDYDATHGDYWGGRGYALPALYGIDVTEVNNDLAFFGATGVEGMAVWDERTHKHRIAQLDC